MMRRKFSFLHLAIMLGLSASLQVFGQEETVFPVSLKSTDWDASQKGSGSDLYNEEGALVLEILSNADPYWQGIVFNVIDLNLDIYPNGRVRTTDESTAAWSLKLYAAGMGDQTNPWGGDQTAYGEKTFVVGDVTGQSGVSSFELWLWGIGAGQKVVFDKMEFFGDGTGIVSPDANPCIFHAEKGKLVFNGGYGKSVTIYTVDGKLVKQFEATSGKSVDLATGLYLVKAGTTVVKTIVP
jgi:hypothetical protein